MTAPADERVFPDQEILAHILDDVLRTSTGALDHIVERVPNPHSSTFDSEIVLCTLSDGRQLKLLCKYGPIDMWSSWGHRRGVAYEDYVYRHILEKVGVINPRCFGMYVDHQSGTNCLVLSYVDGASHMRSESVPQLGRWLGELHRHAEGLVGDPGLIRYDLEYFSGWANRTWEYCRDLVADSDATWLATACERFANSATLALLSRPSVIHGECYRKNILIADGQISLIDWESCAVAAGEIDLAMVTEGWSPALVSAAEERYREARWPGMSPPDFDRRLALARAYMHFRWLGNSRERTTSSAYWRLKPLRDLVDAAGLSL
jgi:hypothetical protein